MLPSIIGASGIGDFPATALQKKLAGKQVSLTPIMGNISEGFSGSASIEDLETLFQLLHLYMTGPRRDEAAFTSLGQRLNGLIANRLSQPEAVFSDRLQALMSGDHFRRRPLSPEVLEEMDLNRALEVYGRRFTDPKDFTFFISGSFDRALIEPLILKYIGGLKPAEGEPAPWRDEEIYFPEKITTEDVFIGIEPKSRVTLVFGGEIPWSYEREHLFDSFIQVLDMKLREVIREDASGTYGVGVAGGLFRYPREEYRLQIYFGCEPERVEELTDLLFQELEAVKEGNISQEVLEKIAGQQKRSFEQGMKENSFWLQVMRQAAVHELSYDEILDIDSLLAAIDRGSITELAEEILNFDRYVLARLFPEEGPPVERK